MKIEKTINDEGIINMKIDGKVNGYAMSRILTGTTGETGEGIFESANDVNFEYGDFRKSIYFPDFLGEKGKVEDYAKILTERISAVREWVAKCRATAGTIEIKDLPDIVVDLAQQGKLYYHNSKGQITPLI